MEHLTLKSGDLVFNCCRVNNCRVNSYLAVLILVSKSLLEGTTVLNVFFHDFQLFLHSLYVSLRVEWTWSFV